MTDELPSFQAKILRQSTDTTDFAIYKAALEWSLIDPIVIDGRDDLHSESTWRDRVEPFHHQVKNLITFCRRLPVTLLADDVGLGKTISAGLIASELISRRRVNRMLVVAPKLLGPQWKEELETKFNIPGVVATGKELIDAEPDGEIGAVITTYHAAREHLKKLPDDRFQMLILDEAHKLRNLFGTPKPPQVALRFREVLEERKFRYVLMLTATPIQNRLWDLYSLVELLSVARGHENPFGRDGIFARRFIADNRTEARQLKLEAREEFRDIVYSYMSRVRRGDANLHFPERSVLLRGVEPTPDELTLIAMLVEPLRSLNRLAQISILQALTSSPDALAAQLANMARRGTFPTDAANEIRALVKRMPRSAKLKGLAVLVAQLRRDNPNNWRMVVFTQRRETQTTIEAFLNAEGISVGTINGESGPRNQQTIADFKCNPPKLHVIVSTEAGSEGVNLQAANVLVNFDLPWNPMIVEQRIGRVQRLASQHAKVFVYSVILSGTFEEYIVARLMQKLQMASHAIGDIEALLEASGLEGEGESEGFEEEIRRLVMASLEGMDVEAATQRAMESIDRAKLTLAEEEENINALLGSMNGAEDKGPRTPNLPPNERSMTLLEFVPTALQSMGASIVPCSDNVFRIDLGGRPEEILVSEEPTAAHNGATLYAPGSGAFDRLITRITQSGLHNVVDLDNRPRDQIEEVCRAWVDGFSGAFISATHEQLVKSFSGNAVLQIRATVAHDSFERLVTVECDPSDHWKEIGRSGLGPLKPVMDDPADYGIDGPALAEAAMLDGAVSEFCRFYKERREREVISAGEDARKRTKLFDDFTPRLQSTLVGLEGKVCRVAKMRVCYGIDGHEFTSVIVVLPFKQSIVRNVQFLTCSVSGRTAPADAFDTCCQSHRTVLAHLLVASEISGRKALPDYVVSCELTGKKVLTDEVELSALTNRRVAKPFLKSSAVSSLKAEADYLKTCEVTGVKILPSEIAKSELSGRQFRADEAIRSAVSGMLGHKSEFIRCELTGQSLFPGEAERCEVTGRAVMPGQLEVCQVSGRHVLPSQLQTSTVSGRRALGQYVCRSSISQSVLLQDEAVRSLKQEVCTASEAIRCAWSDTLCHPNDVDICNLTGLQVHQHWLTTDETHALKILIALLAAPQPNADRTDVWPQIAAGVVAAIGGNVTIESASLSQNQRRLAFVAVHKKYLGLRSRIVGGIYDLDDRLILGRLAEGTRAKGAWASG